MTLPPNHINRLRGTNVRPQLHSHACIWGGGCGGVCQAALPTLVHPNDFLQILAGVLLLRRRAPSGAAAAAAASVKLLSQRLCTVSLPYLVLVSLLMMLLRRSLPIAALEPGISDA